MFSYNCIHVGASIRECVHFRAQSTNRLRVCNSYYLIGCCCINYTASELKSTATQPKLHQSISNYSTTFRAVAARNQTKALISKLLSTIRNQESGRSDRFLPVRVCAVPSYFAHVFPTRSPASTTSPCSSFSRPPPTKRNGFVTHNTLQIDT